MRTLLFILLLVSIPTVVYVQAAGGGGGGGSGLHPVTAPAGTSSSELPDAILAIVNGFLILVGIIAGIILIYGGIQYVVSRGDDQAVSKAKSTILYAVVGLIVVGLAAAIVNFVVGAIRAA